MAILLKSFPRAPIKDWFVPFIFGDWYLEGLFTYTGFARSMELWKKVGPTTRFSQLIVSTLTKLFSLSLLLLFILIIHVNLPLVFSSGPYNLLERESNQCLNNFWQTIFLQNNHPKDIDNLCLIHFWSVSAETQLLLVIVILVFLYKRYPKIGLTCNLITSITSLLYIGYFYYNYQYPAHIFSAGDDESFSSIENFATSVYLSTMSHLWMYSSTALFTYLIMNDYVPTINKIPICKKINENLVAFGFSLFLIQPIYHNLIQPYQNQLILAIYVVVFRVICLIFWFFVASRNSDKSNQVSAENIEKNGFLKQNESTNHQEINQKKSIDLEKEEKQLKFYSIVATILKSTYCVHVTVITIILNSLRHQIVTFGDMFTFVLLQLTTCIIGGLLFHFFILGPFTSIFVSMKKEKKIKTN
ncbi:uncharacterized protein LOC128396640 isoform X3 [Panonychus citri]|uniref:uncharacterized protein LOC128396640 isoform X3 n=1 Tax=Panonychus citri TaxID=50023 RepID=UPI002307CE86|nr:uncharacterized protein LOC128396640 isoform X3 [Panonychus citri]XP_053213233.1 uncharacterized protein LOC128396640 isoform X3 [Panonychus citri]